jgi:hypothetical protein
MFMETKEAEKTPIVVSKTFLTVGPTLHYSHKNVQRCWLAAIVIFGFACLFWSKITAGSFWTFSIDAIITPQFWRLDQSVSTGVSIFEYPWQIIVLGLLMGILAIVPVLISQLMSFEHSIPLILEVLFLANLPGFAFSILISSFAAACRPLRFRSRFIAIALCTTPQLLFWGFFGGASGVEPVKWGLSFLPWICAWIDSLIISGLVLLIGHFTRYKPGLVWIPTAVSLILTVVIFELAIGFDELDYQLYVAKNNPEYATEFRDNSIKEALDESMNDPAFKNYLQGYHYPSDQNTLRSVLKREIQFQLGYDRWPTWFDVPDNMAYQAKKDYLLKQYETFIKKRTNSRRMPIALYFKALLSDYSPDIVAIGEKEMLFFYDDYPQEGTAEIWFKLYSDFPLRPESIEARWRIARHWAGRWRLFDQAEALLSEAGTMVAEQIKGIGDSQTAGDTLFKIPAETVMTTHKLIELQRNIELLKTLIGKENRTDEPGSKERLAQFVMLNPHSLDYPKQLETLLQQTKENDPLRDNILLLQAKLIPDEQTQVEKLNQLYQQYKGTDGGIQALYELGLLRISLWRKQDEKNVETKKQYLDQARESLNNFLSLYPKSFYADQVRKNLDGLS